MQLGQP